MIQRIQSVYLFFVAVCSMATILFLPNISVSSGLIIILPALAVCISILALVNIFLYRKRTLQIKICFCILALILLMYGFIFYFLLSADILTTIAFPLIALVLDYLAIAGIRKDERLVNSSERIRNR